MTKLCLDTESADTEIADVDVGEVDYPHNLTHSELEVLALSTTA